MCDPLTRSMPSTNLQHSEGASVASDPHTHQGRGGEDLTHGTPTKNRTANDQVDSFQSIVLGSVKMQFQFQTSDSASDKGKQVNLSHVHWSSVLNLCCENDSALHLRLRPLSEQTWPSCIIISSVDPLTSDSFRQWRKHYDEVGFGNLHFTHTQAIQRGSSCSSFTKQRKI